MKKQIIAIAAASLLLAGSAYAANEAQFGVVSMQDIIQNSSAIKTMQANFEKQAKPMQAQLQQDSEKMQTLRKDKTKTKELAAAQDKFQKDLTSYQQSQKAQQEKMKNLLMTSIEKVRVKDGLKAIYMKAVVVSSDSGEFKDVTSEVEAQLKHAKS